MHKYLFILIICLLVSNMTSAQDLSRQDEQISALENTVGKMSRLKISGYVQVQYQNAQWGADGYNFKLQNRLNAVEAAENVNYGRFGVRRGRIKFTYDDGLMQAVFQPDFSQAGVSFKDVYFAVKDPFWGTNSLKAGIFDRPFGYEIAFSSTRRESPERSRIFQTLFPDERVYVMKNKVFVLDSNTPNNRTKYAKRQYMGIDAQFSAKSAAGNTHLRAEYIFGEHPFAGGTNAKLTALRTGPVYMRKLNGGYVMMAQDLGKAPVTLVAKYDWFNPNTEVSGNDIGKAVTDENQAPTGSGDIARTTVGLGAQWRIHPAIMVTAYYDIVKNETTEHLKNVKDENTGKITAYGYENVRKENVFTIRLQYRF